jgi:predicted GNAT family acetyltransferase
MEIQQRDNAEKGAFFIRENDQLLAEMSYVWSGDKRIIIDHTEVDSSLKGQGIGKKLFDRVIAFAREKNLKVLPLCPFAKSVFDKDTSLKDLL